MKWTSIQISTFCTNMSMYIASGLDNEEAINSLMCQSENSGEFKVLEEMQEYLNDGCSLDEAMKKANVFPMYVLNMVEIGNYSGKYEECFNELANYYKQKNEIEESISALCKRPLFFFVILAMLLVFMELYILPIFKRVYQRFGATSLNMIAVSYVIISFLLLMIALLLVVVLMFYLFKDKDVTKKNLAKIIENSFLTKNASITISRYQLINQMKGLIECGYGFTGSLQMVSMNVTHGLLKERVDECIEEINCGESISSALQKTGLLPQLYTNICYVGARNGRIDEAIIKIAERLENDVEKEINKVTNYLEPIITSIFTLSIGLSLLSIILPLVSVISSIG